MRGKSKAVIFMLALLLISGGIGGVLVLSDYFAPMFSDSEGSAVLNIETYIDGDNQPTHPSVIDMVQEWNGFRYWMAYSPYPYGNGAEENPCVCVSNDMYYWSVPDGLYNPIAFNEETACDELKDPHIVYNDDLDRLEVWYLGRIDSTIKSGGTLLLFRKTSSDGVHWSEYEVMRELSGYLSPSIVYENGKYKLWAIQPSASESSGVLAYSESSDGKDWSDYTECTFGGKPELQKIWHGAVSHDDKYRFVFIEASPVSDTVLYTESSDGISWEEPKIILQKANFWNSFYRPCILYSDNRYYCIYGVITQNIEYHLSMSTGDSIDELFGISINDIENSRENEAILAEHSFIGMVKNVYHFVQSLCRPELVLFCIITAVILLIIKKCSFAVLWGSSWVLCAVRFYWKLRWLSLAEIFLLLFTTGIVSMMCSLAITKIYDSFKIE